MYGFYLVGFHILIGLVLLSFPYIMEKFSKKSKKTVDKIEKI